MSSQLRAAAAISVLTMALFAAIAGAGGLPEQPHVTLWHGPGADPVAQLPQ